jgi:hypothetical protein
MAANNPTSSAGGGDFDGDVAGERQRLDDDSVETITTGLSEIDDGGDFDLSPSVDELGRDFHDELIALDAHDFVGLESGDFEDPMDGDFPPLPNRKSGPLPYEKREEMEGIHEITVHALQTMFKDYGDVFAGLQKPATKGRNPGQYPTRIVFGRLLETIGKEPTQESLQRFLDACAMINQYSIGREYLWNLTLDANYPHRETIISVLTPGRKDGDVTKRVIVQQEKVKTDPVVRECCADGTH